jgi:hypothetical protein
MPRLPIDYSRTKMYKIVCKDLTITHTYVGHTTQWKDRKSQHKYNCVNENSREYNYPVYIFIRENGGWENWTMILIEDYPCENKLQAEQRERYWIETLNANLNKYIPSRTKQEWNEEHKEEKKIYNTNYYQENKEKLIERAKEIYIENVENIKKIKNKKFECECGGSYTKTNSAKHQRTKKHQDYMEQKES